MKIRELLDKKIIRTPGRDFKLESFKFKTSTSNGTLNYNDCIIALSDNIPETLSLTTFFHELAHAFLLECNIDLNTDKEIFCEQFGIYFKEFLLQNDILERSEEIQCSK